jgi:hypothetical protein
MPGDAGAAGARRRRPFASNVYGLNSYLTRKLRPDARA